MSKERLEEIKERVLKNRAHYATTDTDGSYWGYSYELSDKDYEYLIEQAERVQELEEQKLSLIEEMGQVDERFLDLEQQNKKLREALEFYANKTKYMYKSTSLKGHPTIISDEGEIARKALEELE